MPVPNLIMKIVVVGNASVGKSSVLDRYVHNRFANETDSTIGVDFATKTVRLANLGQESQEVKLHIWDTAGQERFRTLTRSYFRNAAGCMLVYDVSQRSSVDALEAWRLDVRDVAGGATPMVLLGNKAELREMPLRDDEARLIEGVDAAARAFAAKHGVPHTRASARTGDGVHEAFMLLARRIYDEVVAPALADGLPPPTGSNVGFAYHSVPIHRGVTLLAKAPEPKGRGCACRA